MSIRLICGVKSIKDFKPFNWFVIFAVIFRYGIKPPGTAPSGIFSISQFTLASIWTLVSFSSKCKDLGWISSFIAPSKINTIPGSTTSLPIINSGKLEKSKKIEKKNS